MSTIFFLIIQNLSFLNLPKLHLSQNIPIAPRTHSNAHPTTFTKVNHNTRGLCWSGKSQCEVEVKPTHKHGTITARDTYGFTRNLPKCVGTECLCESAYFQMPFNTDEINLIYHFREQIKAETCAKLTATAKRN